VATSGSYNFLSTTSQQFVDEAFERAGVLPDVITGQKVQTAIRSGNLVLTEWINKGYNLWTSTRLFLPLNTNQSDYFLPNYISDVIDVNTRTFQRPLGGTAFSSAGGVAANVFGGVGNCTQNQPNGYISYDYGAGIQYEITMVGVLSAANLTYTLAYEYSNDGNTWINTNTPLNLTNTPESVDFNTTEINWVDITVPSTAEFFRIRETGGATLNIAQIYFATSVLDIVMARISGQEYMTYPDKELASRPSVYWLDRQAQNVKLVIWPVPQAQYMLIAYRGIRMLQDVGSLTFSLEIPARFYDAYCAATAYRLAMKANPIDKERVMMLKEEAKEAYSYAATEDTEKVPLRLIPSYLTGWSLVS
jgi:hypothetical protein